MKCEKCGKDLYVSNVRLDSDKDTTEILRTMTFVCINTNCSIYAGQDLNNPKHIAKRETTKHVN